MTGRLLGMALRCIAALAFVAYLSTSSFAQYGARNGDWRYYAGDAGSTKYSPLDQVNRDNAKDLRIAWRWKSDNLGPRPDFNLESTPLMVGGVLYTTAGISRSVVASANSPRRWH